MAAAHFETRQRSPVATVVDSTDQEEPEHRIVEREPRTGEKPQGREEFLRETTALGREWSVIQCRRTDLSLKATGAGDER